ncbi:hypothetical protein HPG69_011549 [Diceros bicornis minor]|uniref:Uncharacterized protein n=1 Tax=Diceros bicornis minor TaxID=77932 RepID=A0A7J7EJX6_DICBM|nr:hypothetical protein HPG69_011549 [Diceros bicornis minor]
MWSPAAVGPAWGLMRAWPRAPKFIIHNDASETLPEPLHLPTDVTLKLDTEDVQGEHSNISPTSLSEVILSAQGAQELLDSLHSYSFCSLGNRSKSAA